ncbi:MAG: cyclic nucleotide-binding domain-containing protein [Sulfuritalea sp.]|nr:cyclic nucleotide-binding domain-containing protein [Sulfuritalea sp.]
MNSLVDLRQNWQHPDQSDGKSAPKVVSLFKLSKHPLLFWKAIPSIMPSDANVKHPREEMPSINLSRPLLSALEGFASLGSASRYEDEILGIIDHITLFEDLRHSEVSQLCSKMECFCANRGDVIMRENEDGDFLVIVLTGQVAVVKQGPQERKSNSQL